MPKDYAKKKAPQKKRGASRKQKESAVPITMWIFTIGLVVALAGGLFYLKWQKPTPKSTPGQPTQKNSQSKTNASNKAKPQANSEQEDSVPFYELHQDLTNKEVKIPAEDLKLPDNLDKFYYSMPCGSFREPSRADELKARIAMTGNNSDIEAVGYQGETWYRVQLGPFDRKRTAESVRHRLRDNDIEGCIINRHSKTK